MADRSLDVWRLGERVGQLDQTAGRLSFPYEAACLGRPDAVPLSASLPLRANPFDDRAARPFFVGLLPEQERRGPVARASGVSGGTAFALLDAIGGACAGAVNFTHPGKRPIEQATGIYYRALEDRELAAIIEKLPE